MEDDKRPSPKVEKAIWGYVDPMPPVPDSVKDGIFKLLAEYEEKHGAIPDDVISILRQSADRSFAAIDAILRP
jgi:hypothetical protein